LGHSHIPNDVVERVDDVQLRIATPQGVPCTLLAREDVFIEREGIEQLLEFVSLQRTLEQLWEREQEGRIAPFWGEAPGELRQIVLTPDFHKGSGIPVGTVADARGFVVPAAIGNDICCGMRLLVTDAMPDEIAAHRPKIEERLRAIFFGGERNIPLSPRQREAILRDGLIGLHATSAENAGTGLWRYYDPGQQATDLERVHFNGALPTQGTFSFGDFIRASGARDARDPQIGSVGGGNHFVELQMTEAIADGPTAHDWGIFRGAVTIMAHSGSVGLGHAVGGHFTTVARNLHPTSVPKPAHGFYALPAWGPHADKAASYLDAMRNAANFAFANRLFLGLMAVRALSEAIGREISTRLICDAPHNLIWELGDHRYLHRKGACPALGPEPEVEGPFRYTGHPVVVPGSMGDSSYLLAGAGNTDLLASACHGAGRSLPRGNSAHVDETVYARAMAPLRVVTPIDPEAPLIRTRQDILAKHHQRLKEEAPYAYKPITPVIQTIEDANVARRVARLWPLMTVKG
jgi:tRNA-splicing ligase RtcB